MEDRIREFAYDYGPYIEDARRRLVVVAVVFGLLFVAGFFASPYIIQALVAALQFENVSYAVLSPFQLLSTSMDIGLFVAISLSLPLIVAELYEFLATAFSRKERALFVAYLFGAVCLFVIGFAYGAGILYFAALAVASVNASLGLANVWDIGPFVSQSLATASLLGVLFEYPLVLSGLMKAGILRRETLAKGRRVAIAATVILVALLPPTDGVSLIIMSVPLIGMYELTLLLARERKRQVVPASLSMRPL